MSVRTVLALGALAAGAGSAPAQSYPEIERALADATPAGSAPIAVVVVAPERASLVRSVGVDAVALPLGELSRIVVARGLAELASDEGWDLDEPLGGSGAAAFAHVDDVVRGWTWSSVLRGEAGGALSAFRFLRAGATGRPVAEFVAAHGLAGRGGGPVTQLPAAALQTALEHRSGVGFEEWIRAIAPRVGMPGVVVGGPTVPLFETTDGIARVVGEQPRAEVAAAFDVRASLTDIESLLQWYGGDPGERVPDASLRTFSGRDQTSRRLVNRSHGAACELQVLLDGSGAWFFWSADRDTRRFSPLRDAVLEELLGPPEPVEQPWNSAVGFGGGAGGRFRAEPRDPPVGRFRGAIEHFGTPLEIELTLSGRLSDAVVVGSGRSGVVRVSGESIDGEIPLGDRTWLDVDLDVEGSDMSGVLSIREPDWMLLPYRVTFELVPRGEPAVAVADDQPSISRRFGVAMEQTSARLKELLGGVESGRVVAVGRADGRTWHGTFGLANPATGLPMRSRTRVPLGTLTRELFDEALAFLVVTGRLDPDVTIDALFAGAEPPFDRRLLRLAPSQLAMGGAPLADYFRIARDPRDLRPLDDVLRAHAFFVSRADEPDAAAVLPRAVLLRALEEGGVISDWGGFLAFELAGVLEMPGLADAMDATRDRRAIRLRGADGELGPAPLFEVPSDGGAWARGSDVASWMTTLVVECEEWEGLAPEAWERRVVGGRGIDAFVRNADLDDMTCRILLVPDLELGVFVWGADGDRRWVTPAVEAVLGSYWAVSDVGGSAWTEQMPPGPFPWWGEEDAPAPRAVVGSPRTFRGDAGSIGELEVRCAEAPGVVEVSANGTALEVTECVTSRRSLTVTCVLPARLAPGREPDARLVLAARVRSAGLVGELAIEADGRYRLPYVLGLAPVEER